jgi:hypothetical protein
LFTVAARRDAVAVPTVALIVEPWTDRLRLVWQPSLTFYERRLDILRHLESLSTMHAFRVEHDEVGAILDDAHHELRVHSQGMTASVFGPEDDGALLREAVVAVLEMLNPRLTAMDVFVQHVLPLRGFDYRTATRRFAEISLGGLGRELGAIDAAVLFDAHGTTGPYQAEIGIISDAEIEPRLVESIGRVTTMGPVPHRSLPKRLPKVSLYGESTWWLPAITQTVASEGHWVLETWNRLTTEAGVVMSQVAEKITDRSSKERGAG